MPRSQLPSSRERRFRDIATPQQYRLAEALGETDPILFVGRKTPMPKYAPPREDGLKPWVVEVATWGRTSHWIHYAAKASEAAYAAKNRRLYTYTKARRATPEDMEAFPHG